MFSRACVVMVAVCAATAVPSIFRGASGGVGGGPASAGVVPVVADHSGLAEVGAGIAAELPPGRAGLVTFPTGDAEALRDRLQRVLALPPDERRQLGLAVRTAVETRWSWRKVAERLLD